LLLREEPSRSRNPNEDWLSSRRVRPTTSRICCCQQNLCAFSLVCLFATNNMAALVCPSSCVVSSSSSSSCCLIIPTKLQSSRKHVRARVGTMRASSSEAAECNCRQQCTKEATKPLILRRDMLSLAGVMAIAGLQMTPSLDPTAANAAAATAASFCADFSVSPSGLAFCDSSPGSGVQASKGMLIKVWSIPPLPFQLFKILNCFLPWL
jgi:hypothetical protein